jgi:hypothetical protein
LRPSGPADVLEVPDAGHTDVYALRAKEVALEVQK